ncbi:hypothetical protein BS47DRAFT_1481160 [Hydnum rufescens UP504]|uniref:Uncharacterized protein n=1 Tax=Hydnum rufescens UP504 TaxID=1448309 RepID=A0A9P6BAH9_9AGAM|nr:hypothetical protein BS47DRAFT_1481160 [Hydnum rufescens UP504]
MDWHNSFGRRPTKINMFQLRRERSKPLNHQYVVLFLSEDSEDCILRLDRRGDEAKAMDTLTPEGTESIDTIANVKSLSELDKTSDTLAELHCQGSHIHLLNIIKICVGIHRDDEAKNYTLRRFNCYFFAWTMLVATARHVVRWDMLPSDSPWETLSQSLAGELSTKSADAMIKLMMRETVKTVITIRGKLKSQLSRVMSRGARLVWAMPEWFIRLALRLMLRSSGKSGIHTSLRLKLQKELLSTLRPTLHSVLTELRVTTLRTTLWKEDVEKAMQDAARRDVTTSILNAVTTAISSIKVMEEDVDAFRSRACTWGTQTSLEVERQIGVPQLSQAPEARAMVTDDTKWDEVWNSIRDIVRDASKEAMKDAEEDDADSGVKHGTTEQIHGEDGHVDIRAMRGSAGLDDHGRSLAFSSPSRAPLQIHSCIGQWRGVRMPAIYVKTYPRLLRRFNLGSGVENDMRAAMDRVWRAVVDLDGGARARLAIPMQMSRDHPER